MARGKGGHRQTAEIQRLLTIDAQDRVTVHEVANRFQHADGMDVAILLQLVGTGRGPLRLLPIGKLLAPSGILVRVDPALDPLQQLAQHRLAVADDRDVNKARRGGDFRRVDIDAGDLGRRPKARRRGVPDDVVHARAKHDDQVGVAECAGAHGRVGIGVIVRHHAAALRGGVERDAGGFDERLHLFPRPRPDHAGA